MMVVRERLGIYAVDIGVVQQALALQHVDIGQRGADRGYFSMPSLMP